MKGLILAAVIGITVVSAPRAGAQPSARQTQAAVNVQAELAQCGTFFTIVAMCFNQRGLAEASQFSGMSRDMQTLSIQLGASLGMTDDALLSRARLNMEEMLRLTAQQPCLNIASLTTRYLDRCTRYHRDPEGAMRDHLR